MAKPGPKTRAISRSGLVFNRGVKLDCGRGGWGNVGVLIAEAVLSWQMGRLRPREGKACGQGSLKVDDRASPGPQEPSQGPKMLDRVYCKEEQTWASRVPQILASGRAEFESWLCVFPAV